MKYLISIVTICCGVLLFTSSALAQNGTLLVSVADLSDSQPEVLASIFVNDTAQTVTDGLGEASISLAAGSYTIRVRSTGAHAENITSNVLISAGQTTNLEVGVAPLNSTATISLILNGSPYTPETSLNLVCNSTTGGHQVSAAFDAEPSTDLFIVGGIDFTCDNLDVGDTTVSMPTIIVAADQTGTFDFVFSSTNTDTVNDFTELIELKKKNYGCVTDSNGSAIKQKVGDVWVDLAASQVKKARKMYMIAKKKAAVKRKPALRKKKEAAAILKKAGIDPNSSIGIVGPLKKVKKAHTKASKQASAQTVKIDALKQVLSAFKSCTSG